MRKKFIFLLWLWLRLCFVFGYAMIMALVSVTLWFQNITFRFQNVTLWIMHKIKKLFYLPHSIKILFFKTFILPCFDYCTSLFIYFHQLAIHKLSRTYYFCLFRIFKFNFLNLDCFIINNLLKDNNIFSFHHRFVFRTKSFFYKIITNKNARL